MQTFSKIKRVRDYLKKHSVRSRFEGEQLVCTLSSWECASVILDWKSELYMIAMATHIMRQPADIDYNTEQPAICINCMNYNGYLCEMTNNRPDMNGCEKYEKGRVAVV